MICIYSSPSSGRTWLEIMLNQLNEDVICTHGKRQLQQYTIDNQYLFSDTFVYLIRNPYDVLISQYLKKLSRWKSNAKTLDEFVYLKTRKHKSGRLFVNVFEDTLLHHISALNYAKIHFNFIFIHYENLVCKDGMKEFHKIVPHIESTNLQKVWNDNTIEKIEQKLSNSDFTRKYNLKNKLNGGGSKYRNFLTEEHLSHFSKLIDKHDYENKMKELYDVVS